MKSLVNYISERLVINKDYKDVLIAPKSFDELRKIINDRYDKLGPGTKQKPIDFNDIDVSDIHSFYDEDNDKGIFEDTKFKYINISEWNVSNVKNMLGMFYICKQLKSVGDISNWDVSNVEDMTAMFYKCKQLKSVGDISNWDVSNVEDMCYMFYYCEKIKSIGDLSNWDASNVNHMNDMFYNSGIINIPDWYK